MESAQKKRKERKPNVAIQPTIYEESKSKAEKWQVSHVTYVERAIDCFNKNEEFLTRFAPFISRAGQNPQSLYLNDNRLPGKSFEIKVVPHPEDPKRLAVLCVDELSFDCDHVRFALRLPELVDVKVSKPDPEAIKRFQDRIKAEARMDIALSKIEEMEAKLGMRLMPEKHSK